MSKQKRSGRDWPRLVQAQAGSGQSVATYCREQRISESHFYRWRQRCRTDVPAVADRGFVELTPVDAPAARAGVAVVTDRGWRLEVEPGFDAATLERVLACVTQVGTCSR